MYVHAGLLHVQRAEFRASENYVRLVLALAEYYTRAYLTERNLKYPPRNKAHNSNADTIVYLITFA